MLAVRSNCRTAWMEKSAFKTTFCHGPGQSAGGVKVNGLGLKSAKTSLLKSVTTHGIVSGRGTAGSAVAVLADPITRPGTGMLCAKSMEATNKKLAVITIFMTGIENELKFFLNWWEEFIEASRVSGQF